MKRIILFLLTNLAVVVVLGLVTSLLGVHRFLAGSGMHLGALLGFAVVVGFGGAFISLLLSKPMAKWSTGAQIIDPPRTATEQWLVATVGRLAATAGIPMPEVAVYPGAPNAFATGATRGNSLIAVSTGLLEACSPEEIEAVLAHEVAHVANGDMVTLTLIQGVVNTFVLFLSRVVGFAVDSFLRRGSQASGPGIGYSFTAMVCEILFGVLASLIVAWFSRHREFRADAGAAELLGTPRPMVRALQRLGALEAGELPQSIATAGITNRPNWLVWFASHPPIIERIRALQGS